MNVNPLIMQLKDVTGYPVSPDIYTGKEDKYIVFTYEDERGALFADNEEVETQATIQITLYTPANFNYFADKKKIKKALTSYGFCVQHIQSWLDEAQNGTDYVRHTVFVAFITQTEE